MAEVRGARPRRRCRVHYRRLRRDNGQFPKSISLAEGLARALESKAAGSRRKVGRAVSNRVTAVPAAPEYKRLWNNYIVQSSEIVFGDVCLFLPGDFQALIALAGDVEQADLDQVMQAWDIAEQRAPDGMEYLRGISYWTAIGDHFYQIQDVSIQAKAMEEYFTWLLKEQTDVIGSKHYVELQATFDRSQLGEDDLQSIEIGGVVPETVPAEMQERIRVVEEEHKEKLGERTAFFSAAKKIINDLLGPIEAKKILSSIPDDAALEVNVNIGYRSLRRRLKKDFMRNIAQGLRNMPDGEIRLKGKNGQVRGEDARLHQDMNVLKVSERSSLLDLDDAMKQMMEVHRRFLHDGLIEE